MLVLLCCVFALNSISMGITGDSDLYGEERLLRLPYASHCRRCSNSQSSFLAPFRSKMKGLKKFRKRIGLGKLIYQHLH